MASFLPRNGKETSGGGGGSGGRKRFSTVEEGDEEALELAKLDAMEQDVQKLEEKVKSVETRIADIETKMTRLDETEGASFDDLNAFQRKRLGSATAYYDSLERKRNVLRQQEVALRNEIGSSSFNLGAQRRVLPK